MKTFNFNQTGGFPLTTETLAKIQDAYGIVEKVARMAGNFAIITGCEEQGVQITSGVVMINGELLEFRGGIKGTTVFVGTENASAVFENGESHVIETTRYAAFGVGAEQYQWASFKRVAPLNTVEARLAKMEKLMSPLLDGGILLWNKPANTIPAGWAEVTEFRGRMPVGWNPDDGEFSAIGQTGGSKNVYLKNENLPKIDLSNGEHRYLLRKSYPGEKATISNADAIDSGTEPSLLSSGIAEMQTAGSNYPTGVDIKNPYRIVMFIKYVG